jgi:glycolate oxidase
VVEIDEATERESERAGSILTDHAIEVLVAQDEAQRERFWSVRRELSHITRRLARHKISEDVVVPRRRLAELVREVEQIGEREAISMLSYGHAGDGNLHVNFLWNELDEAPRVERAIDALMRTVIDMGGTLSGEHGIGSSKARFLSLEQSEPLIALQRDLKRVFDPKGILNPGKIFTAGHRAC